MTLSNKKLEGKRVAILVMDGFEQVELTGPREAFEKAGAKTTLISLKTGQVQGMNHADKGDSFKVENTLNQVKAGDFDGLLLPGGALNADSLRVERAAQEFVKDFDREGKPIAVICHAPWLLVSAGLVKGRTLTSYHTIQDDIRNAGGKWTDQEVVQDNNWVTSRQPSDIPAFNQAAIELFSGQTSRQDQQPISPELQA